MRKNPEQFILDEIASNKSIEIWWTNDFYKSFCNYMNYDFNDIKSSSNKMRYHLNKLVKKGLIDVKRAGVGEGMRDIRGHNHSNMWFEKGFLDF